MKNSKSQKNKLQTNSKSQKINYKQGNYEPYYLVVSRLVGYKKVDLAVKAFNELAEKLVVVGTGREENKLKKMAADNIIFTSHLTDRELLNYYINAKALIFPQVEDFGLVAVEAQAAGTPVIAYKAGGALDTVVDPSTASGSATGVFFDKQTVGSLTKAIGRFEKLKLKNTDIIKNASRFSKEKFKEELFRIVNND